MSRIHDGKRVITMRELSCILKKHVELFISRDPVLECCEDSIIRAYFMLEDRIF